MNRATPTLRMLTLCALVVTATACAPPPPAEPATAGEVLERCLDHHDPERVWFARTHRLITEQTRPDGPDRRVVLTFPPEPEAFAMVMEEEGLRVEASLRGEAFQREPAELPEGAAERFGELDRDALLWWRSYYGYLYGAPMNLTDAQARLDPAFSTEDYRGRPSLVLTVRYGPGQPVWEYHVDAESYRLLACRFSADGQRVNGELIDYDDEIEAGGMRLPRRRTWINHSDGEVIGVDEIVGYERVPDAR